MIKNLKTGSANTGKKLMKKSGKLHRLDCDTSLIVKNIEKKSYNISIIENYGVLSLPLSHVWPPFSVCCCLFSATDICDAPAFNRRMKSASILSACRIKISV